MDRLPACVIGHMTMAPTISPSRLLQISFEVAGPRRAGLHVVLGEGHQEMARYRNTPAGGLRSVSLLLQVIAQFRKPRLVSNVVIGHVHLQVNSPELHVRYAKQSMRSTRYGLAGNALLRITNS